MSEYQEVLTSIRRVTRDINVTQGSIESCIQDFSGLSSTFSSTKAREEKLALERAIDEAVKGTSAQVRQVTTRLTGVRGEREEALAAVSYQKILTEMKSSDRVYKEVEAISERIYQKLESQFGERLVNEARDRADSVDFDLNVKDLNRSLKRLKRLDRKIVAKDKKSKKSKKDKEKGNFVDTVEEYLADKDRGVHLTVAAIGTAVLAIFWTIASVPVMAVSVANGVNNINNGHTAYEALLEIARIEQNLDKMNSLQEKKAKALIKKKQKAIEDNFQPKIDKLENQVLGLNKEIEKITSDTRKSFVFDDTDLSRRYAGQKDNQEATLQGLKEKLKELQEEELKLLEKKSELESKLLHSVEMLKDEFLNPERVGESTKCIEQILLDIDGDNPIFFNFPRTSCLFVYDEMSAMNQFVRLFITQIRTQMSMEVYNVEIFDSVNLGSAVRDLASSEIELVPIYDSEEEVKDSMEENLLNMRTRLSKIKSNYDDIFDYNEYLESIDSLLEPYRFYFYLDPDPKIFDSDTAKASLGKIGFESGVFSLVFCSKEDLKEITGDLEEFVSPFSNTFLIDRGEIVPKAKDFLVKHILS